MSAEPKHFPPLRWIINQPYLLLSLTSLFWAGNIVLARFVAGHVPPLTLSCVRWIGAFILLWPFAKEHLRRDWRTLRAHLPLMLLLSASGSMMLVPFAWWEMLSGFGPKVDLLTAATLAYVVIFPSTLAYLCFNRGIMLIGPNRAAPFLHLVPVFGSVMAIVLLGEQPKLFHVIGYALVLAGVVIASRQGSARG